jgi:hypothetical protein
LRRLPHQGDTVSPIAASTAVASSLDVLLDARSDDSICGHGVHIQFIGAINQDSRHSYWRDRGRFR